MQYALGADATTEPAEGWITSVPTGTNPGTYYVWYKVIGDAEHSDSDAACVTAEIKSAALTVASTGYTGTYDGQPHGITVAVVPAEGTTITFGTTEGTYDLNVNPTLTDAGMLTVYFKVSLAGYTDYTGSAVVTISKAVATVTAAPAAIPGLVSTGAPQALITSGTASGGEMQYALGTDAATAPAEGWSTAIPSGIDAGTYSVWYKAAGDANHNDSAASCVTATIGEKEKIDLSEAEIGKITDQTYTGKKIIPELKVRLGDVVLVQDVDYTVQLEHNKKIGYATVNIIGINGYKGETKKQTFRIVPIEKKKKKIKVKVYDKKKKKTSYTITGLTSGKTYYIRVRNYKNVRIGKKTEKFCSEWSKTIKMKLK